MEKVWVRLRRQQGALSTQDHQDPWYRPLEGSPARGTEEPCCLGEQSHNQGAALGSRTYHFLVSCPGQVTNRRQPQVTSGANTLSYGSLRTKAFFHITHLLCATQRARLWDAVSLILYL